MLSVTQPVFADVCYFLLLPWPGERPLPAGTPPTRPGRGARKDTPYFLDLDIELRTLEQRQLTVAGTTVQATFQLVDQQVWVAECLFRLDQPLHESAVERRRQIQTALNTTLQAEVGYHGPLAEEYTVLLLREAPPNPDDFVADHAVTLARLLRSVDTPPPAASAADFLVSRCRYSSGDLVIVDWEGAVLIDELADFEFDLALLKLGNYQLLRYRMLDVNIEQRLKVLHQQLQTRHLRWYPGRANLRRIVEQRLTLLFDFEKTDQSLLLIGDWYSAQVYRLIVAEFYLDDWKAAVSTKLDNLASIDEIIRQDLAFSWDRLLDIVQIIGWLLLLIGYFVLYFADIGWLR